ncbi:unnamed protein product [Phytophthora fragariaefolia]|uniref:Unnamed protein product n=1 Tax=Phytophthora fragariaefolia TaxID=1490495 RepID=A0A9W6Y886_9STRA|nr:unnamed protein product [Phytophthora fragariaefolia]
MKGLRDGPVKTYLFREYPTKKLRQLAGAGPPAGDAVERVDIGHAVSKAAAPSERHSHCKTKDDKPNLGSLLEVRLATGVVVRTGKRVVSARFSYDEKKFVDELIVLDLDDKFDMVLGMPWLARHDPVIDWAKRTTVRFSSSGATESDGPVGAAHAPRGTCDHPAEAARGAAASDLSARTLTTERVVREKCEPNQKTQIQSDLRGSRSVKGDAVVSTTVDTQVEQEWSVTEGSDLDVSAPGADAIGPKMKGRSTVRRRGKRGASAPGADAASSADGCKRPKDLSTTGPGENKTRGTRFSTRSERPKRAKLRKSRSGTETLQAVSARQTQQTGDDRRDTEWLDAYGYWSPVSEDGA